MRPSEIDWNVLRGAVVLLVVAVLISGTALALGYQFDGEQEAGLQRARSAFMSARNQYHTLDDEEDLIATYLPRYSALEDQGVIGREQRLDWIDVLRESARAAQVQRLAYVIDAQRVFDTGVKLEIGDYRVYSSSMRLNLGLLHEGDLLRFLSRLRDGVSGLLAVSDCSLTRAGAEVSTSVDATNVDARCVLDFITIRGPEQAPGAAS